uniref:Uncharacterized protein n=1 Tax=Arundo donax TaxID=35708 RepID=A0A0A9EME3_ARUDO
MARVADTVHLVHAVSSPYQGTTC